MTDDIRPESPALTPQSNATTSDTRRPDPGSRYAAALATILTLVVIPAVVFLQQCESPPPAAAPQASTLAETPETEQFAMVAKIMVKIHDFFRRSGSNRDADTFANAIREQLDDAADPSKAGFSLVESDSREARLNKLRVAIAIGEIEGDEAALKRIEALSTEPESAAPEASESSATDASGAGGSVDAGTDAADGPADIASSARFDIAPDLEPLWLVYSGRSSELTDEQKKSLVERHGWLGRVAVAHHLPLEDPARESLLSGGGTIIAAATFLGLFILFIALASITAFIVMLVQISGRRLRMRFVPPSPGGSVYLETLLIFALSFVVLKVGGEFAVTRLGVPEISIVVAQWALLLIPFWPLLRGVPFAEHRRLIGWHSGRGVFREIGAGLFGYLAGLVLLVGAMVISMIVIIIKMGIEKSMGKHTGPPKNPIVEHLMSGSTLEIVLLACLATVWAPIVEEAVFRGSLFRHLRSRRGVLFAALVSSFVFGVMHPYPFFLLLPVITLGFIFALLREWRGSLIAPMTAHALHNGMLVGMLVLVLSIMKD